jgi:methyltransferase (TIGR00027 family)
MRGRPSLSARWAAANRARLERTRPSTPAGDVAGERALEQSVRGPVAWPAGRTAPLAERTRFVDHEVADALGRGLDQVVLLGAGYDGRALRFGGGPARWFEVDLPEILADKRRRLDSLGVPTGTVRSLGLDVRTDDVGTALASAGHDAGEPSLFVAESLFATLTLESVAALCEALRARAAPGSVLAATFSVSPEHGGRRHAAREAFDQLRRAVGQGRPNEFLPGDPQKLFVVTGWRVIRTSWSPPGWLGQGSSLVALAGEPHPGQGHGPGHGHDR